jgi:superfamily II helicase
MMMIHTHTHTHICTHISVFVSTELFSTCMIEVNLKQIELWTISNYMTMQPLYLFLLNFVTCLTKSLCEFYEGTFWGKIGSKVVRLKGQTESEIIRFRQ